MKKILGWLINNKKNRTAKICNIRDDNVKSAVNDKSDESKTIEYLDDITFIKDVRRFDLKGWQQYDILLDAQGYGWADMIKWADYMTEADLKNISEVTVDKDNITESYRSNCGKCSQTPELNTECRNLSVAGISDVLRMPMKIVWYNQTRMLRFFTLINDEMLIKKYAETVVRRNFGTADAMKPGKPIPQDN